MVVDIRNIGNKYYASRTNRDDINRVNTLASEYGQNNRIIVGGKPKCCINPMTRREWIFTLSFSWSLANWDYYSLFFTCTGKCIFYFRLGCPISLCIPHRFTPFLFLSWVFPWLLPSLHFWRMLTERRTALHCRDIL